MDVYTEFIAWLTYAKAEMALAEIEEERCANNLKVAESFALIGQWDSASKGDRITLAKARRDIDPKVIAATDDHLKSRAYRKLVESMYDRCDRGAQLVSRELSRRISLLPKERANSRWSA